MLDLIGLAVLLIFTLLGAVRGTLASALRIATLFAGYAAALLGAPRLGPDVATRLAVPGLVGKALAAGGCFLAAYLGLGLIATLVRAAARHRRRPELPMPRGRLDRCGGALLGALQGGAVILLLGLLVSYAGAWARSSGALSVPALTAESSTLVSLGQSLARKGAEAAFGNEDSSGRVAVELVANPAETVERFQRVMQNPRVQALQLDQAFWSYVEAGSIDIALNRPSFLSIAYDDSLRGEITDLGFVSEAGRADPRLFRNSIKDLLKRVGPRLQRLKHDPVLKALEGPGSETASGQNREAGDPGS